MHREEFVRLLNNITVEPKVLAIAISSIVFSGWLFVTESQTVNINKLPPLDKIKYIDTSNIVIDTQTARQVEQFLDVYKKKFNKEINKNVYTRLKLKQKTLENSEQAVQMPPPIEQLQLKDLGEVKEKTEQTQPVSENIKVQGIYISGKTKFVLIEGKIYFEKQQINDNLKVEKINESEICLIDNNGGKMWIKLN